MKYELGNKDIIIIETRAFHFKEAIRNKIAFLSNGIYRRLLPAMSKSFLSMNAL